MNEYAWMSRLVVGLVLLFSPDSFNRASHITKRYRSDFPTACLQWLCTCSVDCALTERVLKSVQVAIMAQELVHATDNLAILQAHSVISIVIVPNRIFGWLAISITAPSVIARKDFR